MFDFNSDIFKPIIGARLIRDEAKKQAGLEQLSEVPAEGKVVNPELGNEIKTLPQGKEMLNIGSEGGSKERG